MNTSATVAWEGRFGDADLKIEIPPSGRIHAEWKTPAGTRNRVVDSIEQLERSVLFQLMVGKDVPDEQAEEVADAVALTLANRLEIPAAERPQHRRKKTQPRRGGPQRRRPQGRPPGPRRRR